jgi:hypothetical protein
LLIHATLGVALSFDARILSDFLGSAVVPTAAVGVSPTAFPVTNERTLWVNP